MLWSKFWNHFHRNNSHESFIWSGRIKRDVNLDYLGFPIFWAANMDLLITMKYWIFLFLVSCQEKFPPVLLNIIFLGSAVQEIQSYFLSVFSCIQSEYRKIRTRNNSLFRHFSCCGSNLLHLMLAIVCAYASTRTTILMCVKNSTCHLC